MLSGRKIGKTHHMHITPTQLSKLPNLSLSLLRNSSESNKIFGSNNNAENGGGGGSGQTNAENGDGQRERGKAYDDESEETKYSYCFFHFIMFGVDVHDDVSN